jgi:hypothetical protein
VVRPDRADVTVVGWALVWAPPPRAGASGGAHPGGLFGGWLMAVGTESTTLSVTVRLRVYSNGGDVQLCVRRASH